MIAAPRLTGGDGGLVGAGGDFHRYFLHKFKLSAHGEAMRRVMKRWSWQSRNRTEIKSRNSTNRSIGSAILATTGNIQSGLQTLKFAKHALAMCHSCNRPAQITMAKRDARSGMKFVTARHKVARHRGYCIELS
jgi:hypothetical protein